MVWTHDQGLMDALRTAAQSKGYQPRLKKFGQ